MPFRRTALAACAAALLLPLPALGASAGPSARVQPWLAGQLAQAHGSLRVYVHGTTADAAGEPESPTASARTPTYALRRALIVLTPPTFASCGDGEPAVEFAGLGAHRYNHGV